METIKFSDLETNIDKYIKEQKVEDTVKEINEDLWELYKYKLSYFHYSDESILGFEIRNQHRKMISIFCLPFDDNIRESLINYIYFKKDNVKKG